MKIFLVQYFEEQGRIWKTQHVACETHQQATEAVQVQFSVDGVFPVVQSVIEQQHILVWQKRK